jgi:hypothetical protein
VNDGERIIRSDSRGPRSSSTTRIVSRVRSAIRRSAGGRTASFDRKLRAEARPAGNRSRKSWCDRDKSPPQRSAAGALRARVVSDL